MNPLDNPRGPSTAAGDFPVTDPARYLAGRWAVVRSVADLAAGVTGEFTGTAEFRPAGAALVYLERGELVFGTHRGPAWRELRYLPDGPGRMRVEFDDGRPFHDLDLTAGRWRVTHPCRADAYSGEFRVAGPDRWYQDWRVRGPAKDQRLRTRYSRRDGGRSWRGGAYGSMGTLTASEATSARQEIRGPAR